MLYKKFCCINKCIHVIQCTKLHTYYKFSNHCTIVLVLVICNIFPNLLPYLLQNVLSKLSNKTGILFNCIYVSNFHP